MIGYCDKCGAQIIIPVVMNPEAISTCVGYGYVGRGMIANHLSHFAHLCHGCGGQNAIYRGIKHD